MIIEWDNRQWVWNDADAKLLQVNGRTNDYKEALPYIKDYGVAIQAGGAMGLWPYALSKHFGTVYTFEAAKQNYHCLIQNVKEFENIFAFNLALGSEEGFVNLEINVENQDNMGTFYTVPSPDGAIPQIALDNWYDFKAPVGFIQLDIEGRELDALQGAKQIIEDYSPVIMVEVTKCFHLEKINRTLNGAVDHLKSLGYRVVATPHRDVILVRD